MPNNDYAELWYTSLLKLCECEFDYTDTVRKLIAGKSIDIWNTDWLDKSDQFRKILEGSSVVVEAERRPISVSDFSLFDAYPLMAQSQSMRRP